MPYLVDTNILLRICDETSEHHRQCVDAIAKLISARENCYLCAQAMIEFWSVATRPRNSNGLGISPDDATASLTDFRSSMILLPEPLDIADRWQSLVSRFQVRGRDAHDTRLVAFMDAHQLQDILTINVRDFTRFGHIRVTTPSEILRERA